MMGDADPRPSRLLLCSAWCLCGSSGVVVFLLLPTQEEAVERWGGPSLSPRTPPVKDRTKVRRKHPCRADTLGSARAAPGGLDQGFSTSHCWRLQPNNACSGTALWLRDTQQCPVPLQGPFASLPQVMETSNLSKHCHCPLGGRSKITLM